MAPSDTMPRPTRSEPLGPSSPPVAHSRSQSVNSDRPSTAGYGGLLSPPSMTNPEPIYIAATAASQIVTNDHDSHSDSWFDQHGIEPSGETALVSPGALKLVNSFLDQILFNFLSLSRSISLASLRPAVSEVLKPKLAKDVIGLADAELQEYLGSGEDEELLAFHNDHDPSGDWDLELVWKRTRLRCMVYSSLGDLEEEDEDHYTEIEQLDGRPGSSNRFSSNPGVVSPAVAIFLTCILEYMGEQALVVAGQAAYHRLRAKHEKEERDGMSIQGDIADRVVVDEMDMERVALDRTLGRLWRGWKKRIRSPTPSMSMARSFSRESLFPRTHSRKGSIGGSAINDAVPTVGEMPRKQSTTESALEMSRKQSTTESLLEMSRKQSTTESLLEISRKQSTAESLLYEYAVSVPLPMYDNDIREIEIPGLANQSDDEDDAVSEDENPQRPRPKSLMIPRTMREPLTPASSQPHSPIFSSQTSRKRSNSLPSPAASASISPSKKYKASESDSATAEEVAAPRIDPKTVEVPDEAPEEDQATETGEEVMDHAEHLKEGEATCLKLDEESNKGMLAGVIVGAAAIGVVSVAGITAVAKGEVLETVLIPGEDSDMEEGFIEEPEIMTSSRVSMHGRISPDQGRTQSPPGSVHSQSVHSLRLVDVSSPRSPARSRHGSAGSTDQTAAGRPALSRSSSIHSHVAPEGHIPRGTSPILRGATPSSIVRNPSSMSTRQARSSADDSISELEEQEADPPRSASITPDAIPERSPLREVVAMRAVSGSRDENQKPQLPANAPSYGEPKFVLAKAPAARPSREVAVMQTKNTLNSSSGVLSSPGPKTPESGEPPLTPLREMMEGASDTSDEASSIGTSYKEQSEACGQSPGTPPSKASRSQEQAKPVRSAVTERSRASPPQVQRDDNSTPRPETHGKAGRKLHTSSSNTSPGSQKLRPIRTSEDSMPSVGEDKGKSFEQLIRSDQTLQYTLTPQNMRQIESADSPRNAAFPQLPIGERPRTGSSASKSKLIALASNPHLPAGRALRPIARPAANTGAKVRSGAPQARDARVERDSIGDFAEFIRSTGPPGASFDDMPPRSTPTVSRNHSQNTIVRNVSTSPRVVALSSTPRRSHSSTTRRRLQAREAVVPHDDSSELIDFIRQGPPSEKTRDNPRIPRTVAPFRTTMDSDQMSGAISGPVLEVASSELRQSQVSTNLSNEQQSMQSVNSSVNSQSALLNTYNTKKPSPPQKYDIFDEADRMPKRKTRRVRDPYAIDISDEEDGLDAPAAKPIQKEESLVEFLKNVPPPPSTASSVSETVSKPVAKKISAPSLMSRFSRNSNSHSKPSSVHSNSPSISTRAKNNNPQKPAHIPIAVSSKHVYSSSSPSQQSPTSNKHTASASNSSYVSRLNTERKPSRDKQNLYQPKAAVGNRGVTRTPTSDLADFLKNTTPPPSNGPQRLSIGMEQKEEGSFARMFGRRKKSAVA